MRRPAALLLALLCAVAGPATGAEPGAGPDPTAVAVFEQADFVQQRTVPALDRPLVSSGSVTLSANGFVWEQLEPFHNTLTFDGEAVTETTQVGADVIRRSLDDPATLNLTRTLFETLSGSWAELREAFEAEWSGSAAGWTLRLVPADPAVRDVVPEIQVAGGHYVERVRVRESGGGETLIELANQRGSQ